MKYITQLFFGYTGLCLTLASCVYFFLEKVLFILYGKNGHVFGVIYRMLLYHEQHPYQYIAVISVVYGGVAALWAYFFGKQTGWKRVLSIFFVMVMTIIISSVPGGILWVVHDMQAGFFPAGKQFRGNLMWGAITGFKTGWIIIALSVPYNIICLVTGYWVTGAFEKRMRGSL